MPSGKILIIAGPNGAGKTTFAREHLPHEGGSPVFVNADLITEGLSRSDPAVAFRAGRLMLEEIRGHARVGRNFAFETTLSGRGYMRMIRQWRGKGYSVKLIFLSLVTPEEAVERVATRVRLGGHGIPEAVIRRRFHAGLRNFHDVYRHGVDYWKIFNNSGTIPVLEEEGEN